MKDLHSFHCTVCMKTTAKKATMDYNRVHCSRSSDNVYCVAFGFSIFVLFTSLSFNYCAVLLLMEQLRVAIPRVRQIAWCSIACLTYFCPVSLIFAKHLTYLLFTGWHLCHDRPYGTPFVTKTMHPQSYVLTYNPMF